MIVVLVHGWSVMHTETYGALGARLARDSAAGRLPSLSVRNVYLGRYVSFSDEVRLEDLSRAFEACVQTELRAELERGDRLAVIAHSTGGPVIRDWWERFYRRNQRPCPMTHLIMLAPANFGSALAQLGKTRIADLKVSIVDGVDPGVGVLDWLEHGSPESWALNEAWIRSGDPASGPYPVYQFVLTGQTIDRKLYDHVNAYTGEAGSDGVVRVASANLNASYLRLEQGELHRRTTADTVLPLVPDQPIQAPRTAFALLRGRAHAGKDKGILRSIQPTGSHPTYRAIIRCLGVRTPADYASLIRRFEQDNQRVRRVERVETRRRVPKRTYFHDAYALIIARVRDDSDFLPDRLDFKFTGSRNDPDALPGGMLADRQRNRRDQGTLTFYLNADAALGCDPLFGRGNLLMRAALPGLSALGLQLFPRPRDAYVGHARGQLTASRRHLDWLVKRDQTLLLDIRLRRIVRSGTFQLTRDLAPASFRNQGKGSPVS